MLLTTPSDLDLQWQWIIQDAQRDFMESWTRSQQIYEEAQEACVTAAQLMQETARRRHCAGQLRAAAAQLRAEGMRRRHKG